MLRGKQGSVYNTERIVKWQQQSEISKQCHNSMLKRYDCKRGMNSPAKCYYIRIPTTIGTYNVRPSSKLACNFNRNRTALGLVSEVTTGNFLKLNSKAGSYFRHVSQYTALSTPLACQASLGPTVREAVVLRLLQRLAHAGVRSHRGAWR